MANWRKGFDEKELRRIDQIMTYSMYYGYKEESDQALIETLVARLQNRDRYVAWLETTQVWWWKKLRERPQRRYTCHLLKRMDYLILWTQGKKPFWNKDGVLSVGHYEPPSHFPQWMYSLAIKWKQSYRLIELILDA
jgi:hypothetical protein